MKKDKIKIIKKSILFIIIMSLIIININCLYLKTIENQKQVYKSQNEYLKLNNIKYVFFGDSHTRNSINPKFINNTFNFGTGDEDYVETYYKFKKIIEENKNIKITFFEIDPHTFSDKLRNNNKLFAQTRYWSQYLSLKEIKEFNKKSYSTLYIEKYLPVIGNGKDFLNILIVKPTPLIKGWTNSTKTYDRSTLLAQRRYDILFNKNPKIDDLSFEYFLKTIKLANDNNISVVLIKYPLSKEFYDEMIRRNYPLTDYYTQIIDNITINYTLLDYQKDYFNHPEYFSDPDHLNNIGSMTISESVNEYINNISI